MPLLIALAISIGVLAVAATWLFLGPMAAMNVQIWQAFVAWACFFHCGGKSEGAKKTAICMSFGAVVGALAVLLAQGSEPGRGAYPDHRLDPHRHDIRLRLRSARRQTDQAGLRARGRLRHDESGSGLVMP